MKKISIEKLSLIFKRLTKAQKKIIAVGVVILIILVSFWYFIYWPQGKKLTAMKKDIAQTENEIAQISRLVEGEDLATAVSKLKLKIFDKVNMLPSQDQAVVSKLLEAAKELRVEVKNIAPSTKQVLEGKISGYIIEELPITLKLVSEYRALGEFITMLRDNFDILIKVNDLDIRGGGEGRVNLNAELKLSAYLARKK